MLYIGAGREPVCVKQREAATGSLPNDVSLVGASNLHVGQQGEVGSSGVTVRAPGFPHEMLLRFICRMAGRRTLERRRAGPGSEITPISCSCVPSPGISCSRRTSVTSSAAHSCLPASQQYKRSDRRKGQTRPCVGRPQPYPINAYVVPPKPSGERETVMDRFSSLALATCSEDHGDTSP